jgi:hypothetical protein
MTIAVKQYIPLFFKPEWLDIVCGNNQYNILTYCDEDNTIVAIYTYFIKDGKSYTPPFTPFCGPYLLLDNYSYRDSLSLSFKALEFFSLQLKQLNCVINHRWHYSINNWLPFYWEGFEQTTRYTYLIKSKNIDEVWRVIKEETKRQIKKGIKHLVFQENTDIETFYRLIQKTYENKNEQVPYDYNTFKLLCNKIISSKLGSIYIVSEKETKAPVAGVLLVWDEHSTYYLIGGYNHELPQYGAMSFLIWNLIDKSIKENKVFDFHGSMIKNVERFFRNFSGVLTPCFRVSYLPPQRGFLNKISKRFFS